MIKIDLPYPMRSEQKIEVRKINSPIIRRIEMIYKLKHEIHDSGTITYNLNKIAPTAITLAKYVVYLSYSLQSTYTGIILLSHPISSNNIRHICSMFLFFKIFCCFYNPSIHLLYLFFINTLLSLISV